MTDMNKPPIEPHYQHETIKRYYLHKYGWRFLGVAYDIDDHIVDLYVNHEKGLTSVVWSNDAHQTGDYSTKDYDAVCPYNAKFSPEYSRLNWYLWEGAHIGITKQFIALAMDCFYNPDKYKGF